MWPSERTTEVADLLRKHGGKTAVELSIHKLLKKETSKPSKSTWLPKDGMAMKKMIKHR